MNLLNLIEDQTSGYENLRALMRAVNTSSNAQLDLDGEPITLTYPEARFMMGKYKAYNKVGRQAEFIRDLGDARQFDLHMKQLRDLMQKQKDFRGSVPGERGVSGDTYPGQLEEISQPVDRPDPMKIGMLNWTRMLKAFDENRPTVDLEFDGQGQPLTVYRPQMQALFLKAKKMTNQQQQKLVQTLADRIETIEYIDYLRRKGIIPKTPAYNRPETDPKQMDLPFEAKKKESDELDRDTAIDPKVQRAFQIARGRQAAAGSDFEAFVRDEIQRSAEVQQELERVQADNQEQENKINKLSATIAQMARAEPAVAPVIPAKAPAVDPKKEPQAEPRAAEPKAEPKKEPARPEIQPQQIPQSIPRQRPSRPEPKAEPGQVRKVEPDTKVQVPAPKAKPEVPADNVIQLFPRQSDQSNQSDQRDLLAQPSTKIAAESIAEKNDQQDRISTSARTDRMLTQLRIKNPQAENDLEALIYDVDKQRRRQDRDEIEIARLDFENDREEADIDRIEKDLQRIKKQRKVAESVEIISGEFQGQRATIIESKRHFVTVDIQGFGRRVIHESRVAEVQTDINRFNIDRPMLPSGIAKIKYARDNDMYDDARMQESLRAGEYHVATVTLDDGTKHRVKLPSDEGFRELITQHFERKGRKVTDIDVDWSVRSDLEEKKDACYNKVRSRYKVWPSAYASGALVQCRKKGAANWGTGGKKKK